MKTFDEKIEAQVNLDRANFENRNEFCINYFTRKLKEAKEIEKCLLKVLTML